MAEDRMQDSLAALEAELAFQNDAVNQLNQALADQQQDLLLLRRQVVLLGEELAALKAGGAPGVPEAVDEKPPHY